MSADSGWKPSPDTPGWLIERRHPAITNPLKVKLLDEFCFYCGLQLAEVRLPTGQSPPDNMKTLDHMIPIARGGLGEHNLVAACWGCNTDKGNLTTEEYRLVLAYRAGIVRDASHVYRFWAEENTQK
jgi:hypothetical protein